MVAFCREGELNEWMKTAKENWNESCLLTSNGLCEDDGRGKGKAAYCAEQKYCTRWAVFVENELNFAGA